MPAKQTIAVIGAANAEASELLACLLPTGHRLLLMDEAAEKLSDLNQQLQHMEPRSETDIQPCCREASWEADYIVLTRSQYTRADTLQKIQDVASTKIVVCLGQIEEENRSKVAQQLPLSKIVYLQMPGGTSKMPVISGGNKIAVEAIRKLFLNSQ